MFRILLYPFFITTLLYSLVCGEEFTECDNKPSGIFIAVSNNCSKAIYCDGADSAIVDCELSNPYFSSSDEMCYDNSNVCEERPFGEENISSTASLSIPTTSSSASTSSVGSSSLGPLTASSTIATTARPITNAIPTAQFSTTTTKIVPISSIITTVSSTTTKPTIFSTPTTTTKTTTALAITLPCPGIDNPYKPLFFPHPKSCSQYYLCYHGVAIVMQCPNMLYFDVAQQTCNAADRVNCQLKSLIPRDLCLPHTMDVYPHSSNCNYYYICEYGFLMVMQCPFNMAWDYERRACVMRSKAKCYKTILNY